MLKNKEYIAILGRFRIYLPTPISQLQLREAKPADLHERGLRLDPTTMTMRVVAE